MQKPGYRPDVDGLRALAIVSVVFYHLGIGFFTGGFVGVDVFFVISGFLITRLILSEVEAGTFSFSRFYERRARRLFPALFVTAALTLFISTQLLTETNVPQAAGSTVFAITSLSNLFFWSQASYFDTDSITKPLLHTWSLSVEEQFYLVWPLTMVLSWRAGGVKLLCIVLGVASLVSLVACIWIMGDEPQTGFFLTPFRIFEFGFGAAAVAIERWRLPAAALIISLVSGLGLIAFAVFGYTPETRFPGVAAIAPCLGTALAIIGGRAPVIGRVLSNRLTVGLGLISYSLYLIHWPIIVFFDAWFFRAPTPIEQAMMLAAMLALAYLSYRFIETPFRRPNPERRLSGSAYGLGCAMLTIALLVPASWLWSDRTASSYLATLERDVISVIGNLLISPASAAQAKLSEDTVRHLPNVRGQILGPMKCDKDGALCGASVEGKTNVLILGDSHAEDAYNALATAYREQPINFILSRAQSCPPFPEESTAAECGKINEARFAQIEQIRSDVDLVIVVVLVQNEARANALVEFVSAIDTKFPKVAVFGQGPHYTRAEVDLYQRFATDADPFPSFKDYHDPAEYAADALIRDGAAKSGVTFIDVQAHFCPTKPCPDYTEGGGSLVAVDRHHLTWAAATALGAHIRSAYPDLMPPQ